MRLQRLDVTNCQELSEPALVALVRDLPDLASFALGRRRLARAAQSAAVPAGRRPGPRRFALLSYLNERAAPGRVRWEGFG